MAGVLAVELLRLNVLNRQNFLKLYLRKPPRLSFNGRHSNEIPLSDPGLHDWQAAWIDAKVRDHESNKSASRRTGA
jgi:hypothetical protein